MNLLKDSDIGNELRVLENSNELEQKIKFETVRSWSQKVECL